MCIRDSFESADGRVDDDYRTEQYKSIYVWQACDGLKQYRAADKLAHHLRYEK